MSGNVSEDGRVGKRNQPYRSEKCPSVSRSVGMQYVLSLHVPETPQTHRMIGEAEVRAMKNGAYLINNSRGTVVDLDALAAALRDGHLRGAAIDVFPAEPPSNAEIFATPLQGLDNVILTPHIGGSTREAQERIGAEVARKLIEYSDVGSTVGAVNFPQAQLPPRATGTRLLYSRLMAVISGMRAASSSASSSVNMIGRPEGRPA